ncbi:spermatoproteinsis associated 22, variant 3 [Chamberlinius hualienensis]
MARRFNSGVNYGKFRSNMEQYIMDDYEDEDELKFVNDFSQFNDDDELFTEHVKQISNLDGHLNVLKTNPSSSNSKLLKRPLRDVGTKSIDFGRKSIKDVKMNEKAHSSNSISVDKSQNKRYKHQQQHQQQQSSSKSEVSMFFFTSSVGAVKEWKRYRDEVHMLVEIFGILESINPDPVNIGGKRIVISDQGNVLLCLFYEIDRQLPKLTLKQWIRVRTILFY